MSLIKKSSIKLLHYILVLTVCSSVLLVSCFNNSKDAQCVPVNYPDGTEHSGTSYEVVRYLVSDNSKKVIDFFEQELEPVQFYQEAEPGPWRMERIDDFQVLYSCYRTLNFLEVELGCIYVRDEGTQTLIEMVWYMSGDAGPWCEPDLAVTR